jgi:hypothetical protein
MPRREAHYSSLQELDKEEDTKKANDGVSALTNQHRQANIHNIKYSQK